MTQPVIFISYSHKDEREKDRLLTHLGVLQSQGLIALWSDDQIGAGADWRQEISEAMAQARVAILLISANFLTSDFILGKEVPPLLKRRQSEGLIVFPVIAKACAWQQVEWLTEINVRPKNGRPIWGGSRRVDQDLAAIAQEVAAIVNTNRDLDTTTSPDKTSPDSPVKISPELRKWNSTPKLPPNPTLFINRVTEVRRIRQSIVREDARWFTITGPPGVGKSHLALHLTHELAKDIKGAVIYVNLGESSDAKQVIDPEQVISAIARAVGLREEKGTPLLSSLQEYLHDKQALLLLDNFDRLAKAVSQVANLLSEAPQLKVLVTTRASAKVRAEKPYSLKPLLLPNLKQQLSLKELGENPAVELFIGRAQELDPEFELTKENSGAVAEICVRLDGLPLAIELAASQIDFFQTPEALLEKLEQHGLRLLSGGPIDADRLHQTMQGTIEWSYNSLDQDQDAQGEKILFQRLAIFAGSFTEESAEAVCNKAGNLPIDVFDGIRLLFNKSLIQATPPSQNTRKPRYEMLNLIREYGLNRLKESGETEIIERHYAQFFLALAEEAEAKLRSAERNQWFERLEIEYRNLLGVLNRLEKSGEVEISLRLVGALFWFWNLRNYWSEGRRYLERVLERARAGQPTAPRAKALYGAGGLAWLQGDYKVARMRLDESAALWRELGDKKGLGYTLIILGLVFLDDGRVIQRARETLEESVNLFREVEDKWGLALSLSDLGNVLATAGKYPEARFLFEESLGLFKEVGDNWGIGLAYDRLGFVAYYQDDIETAQNSLEQALDIQLKVGDKGAIMHTLQNLGDVLRYRNLYKRAKATFEDCLSLCQELGNKRRIAWAFHHLGYVYQRENDFNQAANHFQDSVKIYYELGEPLGVAECLVGFAGLARAEGDLERSARIFGSADAVIDTSVKSHLGSRADRKEYDWNLAHLQLDLEKDRFTSAWSEGRNMKLEQAIRYASAKDTDK